LFKSGCDDCGKPKLWLPACHEPKCAAPTCAEPSCGHSFNFLGKLRERFGRNECCDGGCSTGGCSSTASTGSTCTGGGCTGSGCAGGGEVTPATPAPVEKVAPPAKKMPAEPVPAPKKTNSEVRIDTPPGPIAAPAVIEAVPTAPAVEITPVPVPRVEGAPRDPF
jgi:hypothetical protein